MALKPNTNLGFSAGVKYWIFFMLALTIVGYKPELTIPLGGLGGIAAGIIAAWSNPKEDEGPPKPAKPGKSQGTIMPQSQEAAQPVYFQRYGFGGVRRGSLRPRDRRFGWLFRKRI